MLKIQKRLKKIIPLFLILIFNFTACQYFNFDEMDFNGDLRQQITEDLSVTYSFYEYPTLSSNHIDKNLITGRKYYESSFPEYEHEEQLLVGWNYLQNNVTGSTELPSYYSLNEKGYISSFMASNSSESLYAVWKKKCVVTFVSNWPGIDIETQILPEGECLKYPEIEYRQGNYRFWGWFTDPEFTQGWMFDTPVSDSMTLYGKWQEVRTIKYYKNDGSDEYREMDYGVDWTNTIDGCMFARNGYGFLGWAETPDGNVSKNAGDVFIRRNAPGLPDIIPDNNLTLYAVWSTDIVTITYIDSTGTFGNKIATYGRGAHVQIGYVINEERNWYEMLGNTWMIDGLNIAGYSTSSSRPANYEYDSGGGYDSDGDGYTDTNYITITNNMTLYVYWQGITFYVEYCYYDDSGNLNNFDYQYVEWNEYATPPSTEPTATGKVFDGWYIADYVWNPVTQISDFVVSNTLFDFNTRFNRSSFPNNNWVYLCAKFSDAGHAGAGTISFSQVGESDITVGVDETVGTNQVAFVAPLYAGAGVYYHWYLNDNLQEDKTGYSATFDYSTWAPGIYDLLLVCCDGTHEYSFQGKIQKN